MGEITVESGEDGMRARGRCTTLFSNGRYQQALNKSRCFLSLLVSYVEKKRDNLRRQQPKQRAPAGVTPPPAEVLAYCLHASSKTKLFSELVNPRETSLTVFSSCAFRFVS